MPANGPDRQETQEILSALMDLVIIEADEAAGMASEAALATTLLSISTAPADSKPTTGVTIYLPERKPVPQQ